MQPLDHHLKNSLAHLMGRTSRAILSLVQKKFTAAGYDITVEQWLLLVNLRNANGQIQQELAANTYKDKTTVTRLLQGLEKKGLAERVTADADGRQKKVRLTPKGAQLLKVLGPLAREVQSTVLAGVGLRQLQACQAAMLQIYDNVKNA